MTSKETAQHYFDLSNESDLEGIKLMFTESTTYRSGSGDFFLGVNNIMAMQSSYHSSFKTLNWQINKIKELKPGITQLNFTFAGISKSGEKVEYSGIESIITYDGKIQHIDVSRKYH